MELHPLLASALEAFPNFVIVDAEAKVVYINKVYTKLLGINQNEAIGKHVTEVIPNTKMDQILKTGKEEIGAIMTLFDHTTNQKVNVVCNRIPLKQDSKIIGAIAMTTFNEFSAIYKLYDEIKHMKEENQKYQRAIEKLKSTNDPLDRIIGSSPAMIKLKKNIADFAKSNLSVLLTGETGVGKEVFASALHELSTRKLNTYVRVNCAAIPKDLLESELFGYEAGAFTGALKHGKMGKFELANNGTILLDEIGEMPLALQSKLLRVLQEKEIERVGGLTTKKINVRVICSTNQNVRKLVQEGKFREDLYYRINTVELSIPPLRERVADIPLLSNFFIHKINRESGLNTKGIDNEVIELFQKYLWPGNVRELEHIIERLCYLNQESRITMEHCDFFKEKIGSINDITGTDNTLQFYKAEAEKEAILKALAQADGNKAKASRLLGIDRSMLYNKLRKYDIKL